MARLRLLMVVLFVAGNLFAQEDIASLPQGSRPKARVDQATAQPAQTIDAEGEVWVDDDFTSSDAGWGVTKFATISSALAGVNSGGTVHVAPGIYAGNITITTSVTILGDPGDGAPGPGPNAPVIDGGSLPGDAFLLANTVSNVTIQGFEMRNFTSPLMNGIGNGISAWVGSTSNITIQDNYFHHLGYNGVLVGNDFSSNPLKWGDHSNWSIRNNVIGDFGYIGFELTNTSNSTIENNLIHMATPYIGAIFSSARRSESGLTVRNNLIDGTPSALYPVVYMYAYDLDMANPNLNSVLIENNSIVSVGTPAQVYIRNIGTGTITGVTVTNNNFTSLKTNTPAVINAVNNFWGSASGPAHSSNVFNVGSQVGNVSAVTGGSLPTFCPWWSSISGTPGTYTGTSFAPITNTDVPSESYSNSADAIAGTSENGTISMAAGTFEEQLEISKSLTLQGAGAATVIKSPPTLTKSFTTSAANFPVVFAHDADGIVVRNVTVDGAGRGNANNRFVGIGFNNAGGTIENCVIKDIRNTPFDGIQAGVGVLASAVAGTPRTILFTGNTVTGFQKNATVFTGTNLTVTIQGNTVTGAGPTGVTAQNGIQVSYGAQGDILENTVSGISYTGTGWAATAILLYNDISPVTVNTVRNMVSASQVGIYYYSLSGTIQENTVTSGAVAAGTASYLTGIVADPGGAPRIPVQPLEVGQAPALKADRAMSTSGTMAITSTVYRNTVTGDGTNGIGFEMDALGTEIVNATVTENKINGWEYGVVYYKEAGATLTGALHGNDLSGNVNAIDDSYTGITQDASGNWFGGDPATLVTPNIDYTPYLGTGVDAAPGVPGFQPDYLDLRVTAAGPQAGAVTRIHEALGLVGAGGTVNIAAGTYVEGPQVVVNTNVSVVGADKNTVIITPSANTGGSGDGRGWFLVNAGKTFNLSGVTLDGAGKLVNIGILSRGSGTITGNILKNLGYNPGGPDYAGRGIATYEANMTISDNVLSNIGRIGIYMYGAGATNCVVTGNTYTGKGAGDWLDYGIEVEGGAHATITGNAVTNCLGVASVDGSTSAGFLATTYWATGTQATITDNTFTNNTSGLAIGYSNTDVTVATASDNDFTGCQYGVTSTAPVVDARNNWWGNGSGPSGGVADPTTATLANGTGVLVSEHVRFDPWSGKAEIVNVPAPGSYSWPQSDVTMTFGTVPPGGGTVTVQRLAGMPPDPPYPAPPAGATYIPLWLMLSSTMPNYSFSATITIDVSDIAGFGATSQIMYLNSITNTWVPVGGTYDDVAKTFTFTTTHFTPYAFVNTPATAFNLYVSGSPATTSGGIYPNDTWGMPAPLPAGYPHATRVPGDWGYTGTQTVDVYIVPQAGMEFGAADLTLEWDAAYLDYSAVSFTGSVFGGSNVLFANSDRLGTLNRIRINASLTSPNNVTTVAGNYIAKLTLRMVKPGHSAIAVIASDLRQYAGAGAPLGLYVTPHQGDVRVYLGDVSSTSTDLIADGAIGIADLNSWAYSYWSGVSGYQFGMTNYKVKFDIGPTSDHYVFSMPQVDGKIDFEDLIIFSISYGLSANHQLPKHAVEQAEPVTVAVGDAKVGGGETRVPVLLEGTVADLRGLSLSFNGSHGRLLGVEKGALLSGYETPVPVLYCERDGKVFVDLAIAGAKAEALNTAGEVMVLRFEGKAALNVTSADARTSANTTLATKVRATVQNELPTEFALQQNYPNPFNPSTTVSYALPAASEVRIAVYNVLGEQVALVSDGVQEAGFYTVQWNGTDSRGQHVTSGVYFLTMRAGEFTAMKKMMLVK